MLERRKIEVAAQFAIDAHQQIEVELRGDALGVVIGAIKNVRRLFQIDADDQHRPGAQYAAGAAHERACLMRLEVADGRARKEARARHGSDLAGQFGHGGEVRHHRNDGQVRKIAAQPRCVLAEKIAGDVDRNIGFDACRGPQQDARFAARTAAEFDQRGGLRKQRGDFRRMLGQEAELAACRIVFRQGRDAIEQAGAGQIVEVFRPQIFRLGGEAGNDVGGELIRRFGWARRAKGGSGAHRHRTARCSNSAKRKPLNCQRADG